MNKKDISVLIQIREYFRFELVGGIKEYGGASNFKVEDAINTIDKILKKYKVKLIELEENANEDNDK